MRWNLRLQSLLLTVAVIPGAFSLATTPAKPIYTEVYTRAVGNDRSEKIAGNLIGYDDQSVSIKTPRGQRDLKWPALTSSSAFTLRSRLIDKTVATDWLALGQFGWSIGAKDQARAALGNAMQLDASLKAKAQAVLASTPGSALTETSSGPSNSDSRELIGPAPTTQSGAAQAHSMGMLARPPDKSPLSPTQTYQKSTPEQDRAAIEQAKQDASEVGKKFGVNFTTLETKHFLLFTDWDPSEYDFLKNNLEGAYSAVSRQFEIPVSENVFVGKLPVYMFAHFENYAKLTDSIGFLSQPTPRTLRGYYAGDSDGSGTLIMYKPAADDIDEAEREWAHCLVHEFTHAFVARYRTNAHVPRWLNEGIAEVIAAQNFPFPGTYPFARRMAHEHDNAGALFDDSVMPSGEWYPVMQTMVELLVAQDHAAFKKMFDAIKDGTDGQVALKKYFGIDYDQLMVNWRQAVLRS